MQSRDTYGNLTQLQIYDYNASAVTRTYNFSYLTDTNYTSRYIRNRLLSANVQDASGVQTTLQTNTYDSGSLLDRPGLSMHDSAYTTGLAYRGNPATTWNIMGSTTTYSYDIGGLAYKVVDAAGKTATASITTNTNYSLPEALTPNGNTDLATNVSYASSFAVTNVVGPNGATTNTTYDPFGRPTSTTIADGATTNYTYSGNTQTATFNDPLGSRWTVTTVDGFGRATRVQAGNGTTTVSTVDTQYAPCACSPLGKVSQVSQPYAPGATPVWTTFTYDGRGRPLTVTGPDGSSVTRYAYQGNQTTVTDPAGNWKTYTNDAFGNLLTVTEPGSLVTTYTYNVLNQLTQVQMPRSSGTQTRTFTWSGRNLMSATNPENGTVSYTYNAVNQVITRTDALQNQTKYTYDSYGRQTKVQHFLWNSSSLQEQTNQEWDYYYDANPFNSSFSTNTWGRIAAVGFGGPNAPGTLNYQYNYNAAGRVTNQRFALPAMAPYPTGLNLDATYTWDNQGRVTQLAYPQSGPTYAYGFDVMGRATSMKENGTQMASVGYNWASQITSMTYDNFSDSRTYDSLTLQLNRLTTQQTTPTASTVLDMSYVYNVGQNNGQIAQSIDHVLSETVNYTYDPLKRLSTAQATSGAWGQTFTYDGFGNMTATAGTGAAPSLALTIDSATNRGFAAGSTTQYYDANGNAGGPNAATGNPYTYDVANRLLTGGYTYDPSGKRVLQETLTGGNITQLQIYFYSISGQRIATYKSVANGSGGYTQSTSLNLFFGGKLIRSAGVTVATDRLGSVRANANGEQFQYWPYGQERTSTANGREKFGTYFRDDPYLDYADQRYYYASAGRFWTPDPAGMAAADPSNPTSWNLYDYTNGDGINSNDPSGLLPRHSQQGRRPDFLPAPRPPAGGSPTPSLPADVSILTSSGISLDYYTSMGIAMAQAALTAASNQLNETLRQQGVSAINNLSKQCMDALTGDGINPQLLAVNASNTVYYSTYFQGNLSAQMVSGYDVGGPSLTLSGYLGSNVAVVLLGPGGATINNQVVVGSKYFSQGPVGRNVTLVHEALHTYTNLDDIGLAATLGLGDFSSATTGLSSAAATGLASQVISAFLAPTGAVTGGLPGTNCTK